MNKTNILIIDPITFRGGSKVATESIASLLEHEKYAITVLSSDSHSWKGTPFNRLHLFEIPYLKNKEQGIPYFLKHLFIALNILLVRLRIGKIDIAVGASGPGVDLSIYLIKKLLKYKIVQFIHGPVARSNTIGRCLYRADEIFHLETTSNSIKDALSTRPITSIEQYHKPRFNLLHNGISQSRWPSPCQRSSAGVFWASSTLKWKGLDIFVEALQHIDDAERPHTQICYITPKDTPLAISDTHIGIANVHWHEEPEELDALRAGCNIFVSTSTKEPFGLSILEAMAAGHCVIIPADGAYWDKTLVDRVNCIKYKPGDAIDLAYKITLLTQQEALRNSLGRLAQKIAKSYQAETLYLPILSAFEIERSDSSAYPNENY